MLRTAKAGLVAATLTAGALTLSAVPAQAVTDFASCAAMHRAFKGGVAKSLAAAHRQERSGHKRPAVRPAVYRANIESDADKDGTACEVVDR
ncbi:MAG TPA: excalibur calcium-binding domain-containing protein [Nocardioides sp.]|nr:excalibur calcium-binding domain-containing protein [Nocardioides sp.]